MVIFFLLYTVNLILNLGGTTQQKMNVRRLSTENEHQESCEQVRTIQQLIEELQYVATQMPMSRKQRYEMLLPVHQALSKLIFVDNGDIRDDLLGMYIKEVVGSHTVGC